MDRQFTLASIDGKAFGDRSRTLTITLARNGNPMGGGFGGCHGWFGQMGPLERDQIKFEIIEPTQGQPQGPCSADQQKNEDEFLTSLKQATRWRLEAQMLILQSDNSTMRLTTSAAGQNR